jgi:hypothetical protein
VEEEPPLFLKFLGRHCEMINFVRFDSHYLANASHLATVISYTTWYCVCVEEDPSFTGTRYTMHLASCNITKVLKIGPYMAQKQLGDS